MVCCFEALFAMVVVVTAPACRAQDSSQPKPNSRSVLILPPSLVFEKLQDETPLDAAKFGSTGLAKDLSDFGDKRLRLKGLSVVRIEELPPGLAAVCGKLGPPTGQLARGSLTTDARSTLGLFANSKGPDLLLAQYL